jgi:type III secretory pathway component EscS
MNIVTYQSAGAVLAALAVVVGLVSPTLERINQLETQTEVINVKLATITEGILRLSHTYEQLAAQERRRGPSPTP